MSPLWAFDFYGNKSHVKWKSAQTDHFNIHYPAELQEFAEEAAGIAESVYDSVVTRYRVKLPRRVDLVLHNSLTSNGLANASHNQMHIWLTDWDFKIRSTHFWMRDVITHEFSHLVSIQSGAKLAPFIHGLQFGYQDYINEEVRSDAMTSFPLSFQPLWFAEGTSQYESTRMGYDSWDSHRDMIMRVSVDEDQLLPLWKMHRYSEMDVIEAETGPYTQGFSLVRFIAQKWGDQVIPKLWSETARIHRMTFSAALNQVLGVSEAELYDLWKQDLTLHYRNQIEKLGPLHQGKRIGQGGFYQDFPQWINNEIYGLSNFGGKYWEGGLFKLPANRSQLKDNAAADSAGQFNLAIFADSVKFAPVKPWFEKGFSFHQDSLGHTRIAYVGYKNRDKEGRPYFDIWVDDTTKSPVFGNRKNLTEVTHRLDAIYPHFSPDGRKVVFVRREQNSNRFILSVAEVPEIGGKALPHRDLFVPAPSLRSFSIYTPKFSPDAKKIAFSYFDGRSRKIAVINSDGTGLTVVAGDNTPTDYRDPEWHPKGTHLIFASDQSGIFNLYKHELLTANRQRLTNVRGGAFTPALSPDAANLLYIGYDEKGFSLYELPFDTMPVKVTESISERTFKDSIHTDSYELTGIENDYSAIPRVPIMAPLLIVEETGGSIYGEDEGVPALKAGFAFGLSDPLAKNFVMLNLLLEVGKGADYITTSGLNPNKNSDFMLSWENRSFPITTRLDYIRRNIVSQDTVVHQGSINVDDSISISSFALRLSALAASAGYSVFKKSDTLAVSLAYQWSQVHLYQDIGAPWEYFHGLSASISAGVGVAPSDYSNSGISGDGSGMLLSYTLDQPSLFRTDTFKVSAQTGPSPVYREFLIHSLNASAWGELPNPIHPGASLSGGIRVGSLLNWSEDNAKTDTLDHFFHQGLYIHGYPFLRDSRTLLFHGEHTLLMQAHYLFPLYKNLGYNLWIFSVEHFYTDLFFQAGRAWEGEFADESLRNADRHAFARSAGVEFRFANRIFYQQPFHIFINLARALDGFNGPKGYSEITPLKVGLPEKIAPTRIYMGLSFQFLNPWVGHHEQRIRNF
jgi:hypothetical protein